MAEAFLYDAVRTPFGRYGGALATVEAANKALGRAGIGWHDVEGLAMVLHA